MHGGELFIRFVTMLVSGIFMGEQLEQHHGLSYAPKSVILNNLGVLTHTPDNHLMRHGGHGGRGRGDRGLIGGFKNYNCPVGINFTDPESPSRCNTDCQGQHGRVGGSCLPGWLIGDYNCYCGASTGLRNEASLQCGADTADFRLVCEVDCICNHAATGGVCDFERKSCECTNVGYNKKNKGCPYNTIAEIQAFFIKYLHL